MTTRLQLGVQQRHPPGTSAPGPGLSQRPSTQQRSFSPSQALSASPLSRETLLDHGDSRSEASQTQFGTPRRGGSKLKLEVSSESVIDTPITISPSAVNPYSSQPLTPLKYMHISEGIASGQASPRSGHGSLSGSDDSQKLPMPSRPCRAKRVAVNLLSLSRPGANQSKKDARLRPQILEPPAIAPQYSTQRTVKGEVKSSTSLAGNVSYMPGTGYADFTPWTGDHPEDIFSETVIKEGYFDKNAYGHNETALTKGLLFQSLKHKNGLSVLSSIFSGILCQRRQSGQITSASTFKPPPRVTLTDTKRELWLKDLANPAISLRKLSRTIPHGIRGRVLLDQCLHKKVPTDRAVWLAKCVGANDIRAFKRKSVNGAVVMGGEAKWVRDWTVFVEQFLDGVISNFGDAEWKSKVNHAIRLASHLYDAHLLDHEHYREWLISSLETSSLAKLPIWVMLIQIYWRDLLRLRRHGRRLVTAILQHLNKIHHDTDRDVLGPLNEKLVVLVHELLVDSSQNFVALDTWAKYKDAVQSSIPRENAGVNKAFELLESRNTRLRARNYADSSATFVHLIKILDGALLATTTAVAPMSIWNEHENKSALSGMVLQWCTSLHRPSSAKIYIARQILTDWADRGLDVTRTILDFLASDPLEAAQRRHDLYHLVAELVKSGHFSIMRYIQWLIAHGGLRNERDIAPEGPASMRLLVELPTTSLSPAAKSMRANLLSRVSYSVDNEDHDAKVASNMARELLSRHSEDRDSAEISRSRAVARFCKRLSLSSRSLKAQVTASIMDLVLLKDEQASEEARHGCVISFDRLIILRSILEASGDVGALPMILHQVAQTSDVDTAQYGVDMIRLHMPILRTFDVMDGLFGAFQARLNLELAEQRLSVRPLLVSLAELATKVVGQEQVAVQLKAEVSRSERINAFDACSPVSDNAAFRSQDTESELYEEIEKLLMSGSSVDRNTMNRLFGTVISKIQVCWGDSTDQQRAYSLLLAKLRLFDAQHLDSLVAKWVLQLRNSASRPALTQIFPMLITTGSLSLSIVLATAGDASRLASAAMLAKTGSRASTYVQEVMEMMVTVPSSKWSLSATEILQFSILQDRAFVSHTQEMATLLFNAVIEFSACQQREGVKVLPLDQEKTQSGLASALGTLILVDAAAVSKVLESKLSSPAAAKLIDSMVTRKLFSNDSSLQDMTFQTILMAATELNRPYCQVKLCVMQLMHKWSSEVNGSDSRQGNLEAIAAALDAAVDASKTCWINLLPGFEASVTLHLQIRAQGKLLGLIPTLHAQVTAPSATFVAQAVRQAEHLVAIIAAINATMTPDRPPQISQPMVAKMGELLELLSNGCKDDQIASVLYWLPIMLSFLGLHTQVLDNARINIELRAKLLLVLAGILLELDNHVYLLPDGRNDGPLGIVPALSQRVFDLSLAMVDSLPEDMRLHCVRALEDVTSDARLRYIFSFSAPPNESLMLAQKVKSEPVKAGSVGGDAAARPLTAPTVGASISVRPGQPPTQQQQQQQQQQLAMAGRMRGLGLMGGINATARQWCMPQVPEKLTPYTLRRWEILNEPTPIIGENDTSLSLTLFEAIKLK